MVTALQPLWSRRVFWGKESARSTKPSLWQLLTLWQSALASAVRHKPQAHIRAHIRATGTHQSAHQSHRHTSEPQARIRAPQATGTHQSTHLSHRHTSERTSEPQAHIRAPQATGTHKITHLSHRHTSERTSEPQAHIRAPQATGTHQSGAAWFWASLLMLCACTCASSTRLAILQGARTCQACACGFLALGCPFGGKSLIMPCLRAMRTKAVWNRLACTSPVCVCT